MTRPIQISRRPSGPSKRHGSPRPAGSILFAALVCLLVVMAMVAAMLQSALHGRQQIRVQRNLRQTELLLQAGADRAAIRLIREADYRGETWTIPADALAGQEEGQVTIQASRETEAAPWRVRVVAEYPFGSRRSVRRSLNFYVPLQTPSIQE